MAYTSIHPIKSTLQKSVDYVTNPDKTDGQIYVSTFACSARTAEYDFRTSLSQTGEVNPNLAYHLIQSFAPGEVSYDEAHRIGVELASQLLEDKYSYVIATHIEKNHVHNHILFCAADNFEHKKYHDCKETFRKIRTLSDNLCNEHGLSVINGRSGRGKRYNRWMDDNRVKTPREQLKSDIDSCIRIARDYDAFIALMKAKGYELKGEQIHARQAGDNTTAGASAATSKIHIAKYIAFKPIGSTQYIRGCERSLGKGYSREEILERIRKKNEESVYRKSDEGRDNKGASFQHAAQNDISAQKHSQPQKDSLDSLRISSFIDITKQKFADNAHLKDWAKLQNLKLAAKEYSDIGSLSRLQEELDLKKNIIRETKSTIAALDRKKKMMGEALMYAQEFLDNQAAFEAHERADNVDKWLRGNNGDNERRYILFLGAREWLEKNRFNMKKLNLEKMKNEFSVINNKRDKLKNEAAGMEKEVRRMEKKIGELSDYLGQKDVSDLMEGMEKADEKTQENKEQSR